MKTMQRLTKFLTLTLMLSMLFSLTVFATEDAGVISDTGDAIQDILENGRFEGAISSIQSITNFIDIWFIRIISIISFFIISAALLKNACAGAYCANSKFWDKVADAHQKNEAISIATVKQYFGGGQFQNTSVGGLKDFLLGIVPNIKAFTDFDDADIEPKAYFMKAIPQMIACVIIGVFIYNGYYRDTASKVGEMGSVLVDRTLQSVNPESLVNSIFNVTSWPDFPWKGDKSEEGKARLKIAEEMKSLAASNFNDLGSAQQKVEIVNAITTHVDSIQLPFGAEEDGYIYTISAVSGYASAGDAYAEGLNVIGGATEGSTDVNYLFKFNLHNLVTSAQETVNTSYGYVRFTLKLEPQDGSKISMSDTEASLIQEGAEETLSNITPHTLDKKVISDSWSIDSNNAVKNDITTKQAYIPLTAFGLDANVSYVLGGEANGVSLKDGNIVIAQSSVWYKQDFYVDGETGMIAFDLGSVRTTNSTKNQKKLVILLQ